MRPRSAGSKSAGARRWLAHVDEVGALADRVTEQLYDRLGSGGATRVSLVHAAPSLGEIHVVDRPLAPFDFARFPRARNSSPPIITLPPQTLLIELAEEYVFAELCEALTLSLAAENEARMRAMTAAKSNVDEDARRARRPLPPAPAGRDHQRDHRAWRAGESRQVMVRTARAGLGREVRDEASGAAISSYWR